MFFRKHLVTLRDKSNLTEVEKFAIFSGSSHPLHFGSSALDGLKFKMPVVSYLLKELLIVLFGGTNGTDTAFVATPLPYNDNI